MIFITKKNTKNTKNELIFSSYYGFLFVIFGFFVVKTPVLIK